MFIVKSHLKPCILLVYVICLQAVVLDFPGVTILHPYTCFFISEVKNIKCYVEKIITAKIYNAYIILFIGIICVYLFSPHLKALKGVWDITINDLVFKYFILLYALGTISVKSIQKITDTCYYATLIMTFWGFCNFVFGFSPFLQWADASNGFGELSAADYYANDQRFRLQATQVLAFDYGFICVALSMFFFYAYNKKWIASSKFYIGFICSLWGIIFCGCRSVVLCYIVSLVVYFGAQNWKLAARAVWIGVLGLLIASPIYPAILEKIQFYISAFSSNSSVEGSSIEMRTDQLLSVFYYIQDYIMFGRGFRFFYIDMGWKDGGMSGLVDKDLWGLEGIYLNLLLERGLVGLFVYISFWVILLKNLIFFKKVDSVSAAFCLSISVAFINFSFMTGELLSFRIAFIMIGLGLGIICNSLRSTSK